MGPYLKLNASKRTNTADGVSKNDTIDLFGLQNRVFIRIVHVYVVMHVCIIETQQVLSITPINVGSEYSDATKPMHNSRVIRGKFISRDIVDKKEGEEEDKVWQPGKRATGSRWYALYVRRAVHIGCGQLRENREKQRKRERERQTQPRWERRGMAVGRKIGGWIDPSYHHQRERAEPHPGRCL